MAITGGPSRPRGAGPDTWYERLCSMGVEVSEPIKGPWGVRFVRVVDPEGHIWALIQRSTR